MKKLRKLTGSLMNFRYSAEYINLLPKGKTKIYNDSVHCAKTNLRRTTVQYELYDDRFKESGWNIISESDYFKILTKHKASTIIRRRRNNVVIETENKTFEHNDIFILNSYFIDRLKTRYINNMEIIPTILNYIVDNGYYLDLDLFPNKIDENSNRFFLYEPDLRMFIVTELTSKGKLKLITTYDPTSKWFTDWLKTGELKKQTTLKSFIKEMS